MTVRDETSKTPSETGTPEPRGLPPFRLVAVPVQDPAYAVRVEQPGQAPSPTTEPVPTSMLRLKG
jgi:hypothetical protein